MSSNVPSVGRIGQRKNLEIKINKENKGDYGEAVCVLTRVS